MAIAGPTVMAGYLHKPAETARTIVDGWLRSGDVGRFDDDGYLVLEAAVVGQPDDVLGEVPTAFVALRHATVDAEGCSSTAVGS